MMAGNRVQFNDLQLLLSIVKDEFMESPTFSAEKFLVGVGPSRKNATDRRTLVVRPQEQHGRPWGRNIAKLVEELTLWTAEYNILGKWNDDIPWKGGNGFL